MQEALCPYSNMEYAAQLEAKQHEAVKIVKRLGAELSKTSGVVRSWVSDKCRQHDTVAPVQKIKESPQVDELLLWFIVYYYCLHPCFAKFSPPMLG